MDNNNILICVLHRAFFTFKGDSLKGRTIINRVVIGITKSPAVLCRVGFKTVMIRYAI